MPRDRKFKSVPVSTDGSGDWALVEVTNLTQTPADALAALIEADVYEWTDELDHDRIKPEPTRCPYKWVAGDVGGDQVACQRDDPDRVGEWWCFDISLAWKVEVAPGA